MVAIQIVQNKCLQSEKYTYLGEWESSNDDMLPALPVDQPTDRVVRPSQRQYRCLDMATASCA